MEKEVVLTRRFLKQFDAVINYLLQEWSSKIAFIFIEKTYFQIEKIKKNPTIGKPTRIVNVRSLQVKPHQKVYYREKSKTIEIDNRKNPDSKPFE